MAQRYEEKSRHQVRHGHFHVSLLGYPPQWRVPERHRKRVLRGGHRLTASAQRAAGIAARTQYVEIWIAAARTTPNASYP